MAEKAYLLAWLKAFLFTSAVEIPLAAVLFRAAEPRLARRLGFAFFANLISHPAVLGPSSPPSAFATGRPSSSPRPGPSASRPCCGCLAFEKSDRFHAAGVSALANWRFLRPRLDCARVHRLGVRSASSRFCEDSSLNAFAEGLAFLLVAGRSAPDRLA